MADYRYDPDQVRRGCAHGHTTDYLRRLGADATGIDLSPALIAEARRLYPLGRYQLGDMRALERPDGSVAAIVAYYAIVHFDLHTLSLVFRELARVLRPGGLLLLTFHVRDGEALYSTDRFLDQDGVHLDFVFFDPDEVRALLEQAQLQVIDLLVREPYPGVEHPSRRAYVLAQGRAGGMG